MGVCVVEEGMHEIQKARAEPLPPPSPPISRLFSALCLLLPCATVWPHDPLLDVAVPIDGTAAAAMLLVYGGGIAPIDDDGACVRG